MTKRYGTFETTQPREPTPDVSLETDILVRTIKEIFDGEISTENADIVKTTFKYFVEHYDPDNLKISAALLNFCIASRNTKKICDTHTFTNRKPFPGTQHEHSGTNLSNFVRLKLYEHFSNLIPLHLVFGNKNYGLGFGMFLTAIVAHDNAILNVFFPMGEEYRTLTERMFPLLEEDQIRHSDFFSKLHGSLLVPKFIHDRDVPHHFRDTMLGIFFTDPELVKEWVEWITDPKRNYGFAVTFTEYSKSEQRS